MNVELKNVSFGYSQNVQVLKDISFTLNKGETLAIVGASGCGKSTLLRIISGILPNDKKNILQGKIAVDNLTAKEFIKTGKLSFMFQEATLLPNLSVKENVKLPLKIRKLNANSEADGVLETVGLSNYKDYLPKQLSGGMKTRVSLARSFISNPEILLLDEPFSALDIGWKSKLYLELENLRAKNNSSVIIVTHDIQEALLLAERIIVLGKDGKILEQKKIISKYSIKERIENISEFLAEIYTDYLIPIQEMIKNN